MIKRFICPDGERIATEECYKNCRMNERCSPLSYLKMVAEEREWKGIPSVTQLQNGTLESYLKLTEDYDIEPDGMAFAISGTKKHANLEEYGDNPEQYMEFLGIRGTADEIQENEDGTITLIDYKTAGSYKVAMCLGIKAEKTKIPDGYYKNGKEKTKTLTEIINVPPDWGEYQLQLNMYRLMVENTMGKKVREIRIFFVVRDGGTVVAKSRGIKQNIYYSNIPFLDDSKVIDYFTTKRDALLSALETKVVPQICNQEERWFDRKCSDYCAVRDLCPRRNRTTEVEASEF